MQQLENIVNDRGSRYAVSGAKASDRKQVHAALKALCKKKKYAKASHNTWAVIFSDGAQVKDDDGESGAGAIMLKMLDQAGVRDHVIIVTRWYGGVHLGADRFRHVRTCVNAYLNDIF